MLPPRLQGGLGWGRFTRGRITAGMEMNKAQSVVQSLRQSLDLRLLVWLIPFALAMAVLGSSPKILIALMGAMVVVIVFTFLREWLILAFYALIAFSVEIDLRGGTHAITLPTEGLLPILFVSTALVILLTGRLRYIRSPLNMGLGLYVFVMYASLLITREPISTVKALIRDSGYIFGGYVLLQLFVTNRKRLIVLFWTCGVVHFFLVTYGLGTQAVGGIRIYDEIAQPFFENHCIYAAYLVISLSFLISFGLGYLRGIYATLVNLAALVVAAAVGLTFVRAAWISVAFMLLYFLLHFRKKSAGVNLLLVFLILDLLAVVVILSTDIGKLVIERARTIADIGYVANYDRLDRWLAAISMWKDEPIHGVGYGAYPDVYPKYVVYRMAYSKELRMGAHNLYLEIMAETGVIGISAFLIMLYLFFREATVQDPGERDPLISCTLAGAKGAMISLLVHAFFNNLGPSDKIGVSLWLLLGLVPCCTRLAQQSLGENWNREPSEPAPESHPLQPATVPNP